MKKHFLLALLALFPLLGWAAPADWFSLKGESFTVKDAAYAFSELINDATPTVGEDGFYGYTVEPVYTITNTANQQSIQGAITKTDGPSAIGEYTVTVTCKYKTRSNGNGSPKNYSGTVGTFSIVEATNPIDPIDNPIDNPTGKIDLGIYALSISKIYGQNDPEPRIEIRNGTQVFTDLEDLDLQNVVMIRRAGEDPGDYNYEIDVDRLSYNTDKYNLEMKNSDFLKIYQVPLDRVEITVTLDPTSYTYDGSKKDPAVTVVYNSEKYGEIPLTVGTDYTLEYIDDVEPGTAKVIITAVEGGKYTGSITKEYTITGAESSEFTFSPLEAEYTGDNVKPEAIVVKDKDGNPVPEANVRVVWEDERIVDVKEGGYKFTVFVTGDTHYLTPEAGVQGTFTVTPKSIAKTREVDGVSEYVIAIDEIPAQYWNGAAKTPEVKLYDTDIDGIQLVKGTDFLEPVYTNNVEPGQATVTITGTGNYTGERTVSFIINKRTIQNAGNAIVITYTNEFTYNTEKQKPEDIVVKDNGVIVDGEPNKLELGTDYEIVWSDENSTEVGTYTFNIVIKSTSPYYRGKIEGKEYNIVKATVYAKADDIRIAFGTTAPDPTYTVYSDEACTTKIGGDKSYGDATYTYGYKVGESPVEVTEMPTEVGVYDIIPAFGENANYDVKPVYGTLTITESQIIAQVAVASEDPISFGDPMPEFTLKYKSGLVVANPEQYFNDLFANYEGVINYVVYKDGEEVTELSAAGDYVVKVANGINLGNYIVTIEDGAFTAAPKDITEDETVTVTLDPTEYTYDGAEHKPAVTVMIGDEEVVNPEEGDPIYTVSYSEDVKNVGEKEVTVTFIPGNYTGTKTATYEIKKRPAIAKVADVEDAPFSLVRTYTIETTFNDGAGIANVEGAVEAEAEDLLAALNAAVTVHFDGVPTSAGTYSNKLTATVDENLYTDEQKALVANYDIEFVKGTLTVAKGKLQLHVKDIAAADAIYGEEIAADKFGYYVADEDKLAENSDLTAAEWNDLSLILKDVKIELKKTAEGYDAENDRYNAGTYADEIVGTASSTNYVVTFVPGTLTVAARPIVVVLENQEDIDFGGELDQSKWSIAEAITETNLGLAAGDEPADLNIVLITDKTAVGSYVGAITIAEGTNENYDIIYEAANLKINGKTEIALKRGIEGREVINLLEGYNGQFVDVTIDGVSNLSKVDYWYSLCLPFQTTVREISNAFGYAVVDVPDVTNTKEGKVVFKLKVDAEPIEANTLMLIKLDQGRNLNTEPVKFKLVVKKDNGEIDEENSRKIDYDPEFVVEDAAGNSFVPTYKKVVLENNGEWYLQQGTFYNAGALEAPTNVKSLQGYFNAVGGAGARIFVQEADGTMTAINSATINAVAAEGWYTIDGMKLNAQPTQKGVYINNGKKVVVK